MSKKISVCGTQMYLSEVLLEGIRLFSVENEHGPVDDDYYCVDLDQAKRIAEDYRLSELKARDDDEPEDEGATHMYVVEYDIEGGRESWGDPSKLDWDALEEINEEYLAQVAYCELTEDGWREMCYD